jgi:hypothetical protein
MKLWLRGTLLALLALSVAGAADLPLKPFVLHEDFEKAAPKVDLWASRGQPPVVNFLGVTEEAAFSGKRSFKIDITFGDSPYYYYGAALRVPLGGKLTMSAQVRLGAENQASVGFGANAIYPPSSHSGCSPFETTLVKGEWKLVQADVVEWANDSGDAVISKLVVGARGTDVAKIMDRWALFLRGQPGQRAVVYIDDIHLEGEVPEEAAYIAQATVRFQARQQAFAGQLAAWTERYAKSLEPLQAALGEAALEPVFTAALTQAQERAGKLLAKLSQSGYASREEISLLERDLELLEKAPAGLRILAMARQSQKAFLLYPCASPTVETRHEGVNPLGSQPAPALSLAGCAGEYESGSVFLYAIRAAAQVRVTCSPLRGPGGATLPASQVDVRVVKAWYQGASTNIGYTPQRWLIPELLLKDDRLVRVDTTTQTNYLRSTAPDGAETYLVCSDPDSSNLKDVRPIDAQELQPVDLQAGENREWWLTIQIPAAARPGRYTGTLTFAGRDFTQQLPLEVTVHPFTLQPSRLIYSIYYRALLSADGEPRIDSERRSEQQYRAEMADMLAHGVLYPTNYLGRNEALLEKQLRIRQEVGLPAGRFYNLGLGIGPQWDKKLPELKEQVRWWLEYLKPWGYKDVYFYGLDEATGERLIQQKAAWQATQEAGGKTFVACYKKTFEAMGSLLNLAVLAHAPDPEEAKKWHSVGSQVFCYANPQVGVEDPHVYRRNFGLLLWKAGFDGAMDYAYQHGFNHVWNDFDDRTYRDHNFTYPTVDGIVGTIAWEGFREAVDDVRYVTTLEQAIAAAPAGKRRVAAEAKKWLADLDPQKEDLDKVRQQMVRYISELLK